MSKLRALVIDDAVLMRRLVSMVLEESGEVEVAGIASNGRIGLQKLSQVQPDFVTLDVEMPEMDGLATLIELRRDYPDLPVIMLSVATSRGAATTLDALAAGASDYVTKPLNSANLEDSMVRLTQDLMPKVRALCGRSPRAGQSAPFARAIPVAPTPPPRARRAPASPVDLLVIGTSTGGPNALAEVFSHFHETFDVPVAIVQHMPPAFTAMLAERLGRSGRHLPCKEAVDGEPMLPGHAYMAPGGRHLAVEGQVGRLRARLLDTPPENSCRPAVDVLFRSAAKVVGAGTLAVVLTGMGSDGKLGSVDIVEAGGRVLAQDEASSVVWGMPGSVVTAGLADKVLPLSEVADEITRRLRRPLGV